MMSKSEPAACESLARRVAWRMRWLFVALLAVVLVVCAWQPVAVRKVFAGVAPDGAYSGLLGLLVLLALLVVPGAVARLVRLYGYTGRAHGRAATEALVWAALAVPAVVLAWKAAPHPFEALPASLVLLGLIYSAGVSWGFAEAHTGAVGRHRVLVVCVLLALLPAAGFVLYVFGERTPWWLIPASPLWLLLDTTPPSPSLARSLALDAALLLWAALTLLGLGWALAARTRRQWRIPGGRRPVRLAAAVLLSLLGVAGLVGAAACAVGGSSLGASALFAASDDEAGRAPTLEPHLHTAGVPAELDAAAVDYGVEVAPRFNFGEFGGDGFALPLTVVLTPHTRPLEEGARLHLAASNFATVTPLPALPADARTELEVSAVLPPGVRTLRVAVQRRDGSWAGASELSVPAYPVAEGALRGDFDRFAPQYLVGLFVAERAEQRGAYTGYREARTAGVPLAGSELPHGKGAYQALSAVVLTTAAREELEPAQRLALATWVRTGGRLIYLGHERSETLWHDLLARLELSPPPPLLATPADPGEPSSRQAGAWRYEERALPRAEPREEEGAAPAEAEAFQARAWRAERGAGQVVRLVLPTSARGQRPVELLKAWLADELSAPRDPLRAYEASQGGRLLAGDLPHTAFRSDALREVPLGAYGHATFAWLLVTVLALLGVLAYRPRPWVERGILVLVALGLTASLVVWVPTRHVEVLELPVWVTRAPADGDLGPAYEVRYIHVTRRKQGREPVMIEAHGGEAVTEFVPASGAEEALGRLPATLYTPLPRARPVADETGEALGATHVAGSRLMLGQLRSGEYRLARLGGLTPRSLELSLEPRDAAAHRSGERTLRLGEGVALRGLMLVDGFRAQPLAASHEGPATLSLPANVAERGERYREVLSRLRTDEGFAEGATELPRTERLALRTLVANAIGPERRFLAAVLEPPPQPRISGDGPSTTRRAVLLIPLSPD